MPSRQKHLLLGLIGAVLLWQGSIWGDRLLLQPLRDLQDQVSQQRETVAAKRDQVLAIELAEAKLMKWRARSLSPDPGKKTRPDAIEAQRQYTAWLTELAHSVGFDWVEVAPQRRSTSRGNVYIEVAVKIDGEGRFSQLAEFLDRFYRTDLLQRIGRLQIASQDVFEDPPVTFSLDAQALALADAPPRRMLFPQTTLADDLTADAASLRVAAANGFPKKVPFRIRIDRELLEVTAVSGETWNVVRGVERTNAGEYGTKTTVSLSPVDRSSPEFTADEFREFVRTNIFAKPTPPVEYNPTFGPFSPPVVVRGKSWQFSLALRDYDPARGEPAYRIDGDPPAGLRLNPTTGLLTWKPDAEPPTGTYPVMVEVRHPSAPEGKLVSELTLKLVDPNTPPKFSPLGMQTIYRGLPWSVQVKATDSDTPAQKLTYQLSDPPAGCRIDAATGEVSWQPAEDHPIGPMALTVSVTDSGTPPQTASLSVPITVQEDTAQQTLLYGIVSVDEVPQALFLDRSQRRKSTLHVGDELRAADVSATITDIAPVFITVQRGEALYQLKLGQTVRDLAKAEPLREADSAETP